MKIFASILFLLSIKVGYSQIYYVSGSGNDNAQGTSATTAWQSINKINSAIAKHTFKNGDRILFHKGYVYSGHLKADQLKGVSFSSYGKEKEKPVISGAEPVTKKWERYKGNIWYLADKALPDNVRKLAINEKYVGFGRWPDKKGDGGNIDSWREYSGAQGNHKFDDKQGLDAANNYWEGAEAVVGISRYGYVIENYKIDRQVGDSFYFSGNRYNLYKGGGHYYYLQNHINTLNREREWAYKQDTIFLYSKISPNKLNIEAVNVETTVSITNSSDIVFEDIDILGSNKLNLLLSNAQKVKIANCTISEGAYDGLHITHSDSITIQNSTIKNIGNNGIQLSKSKQVYLLDNKLYSIGLDRGASGIGGGKSVGIRIESGASYFIKYNEIHNIGYNGITLINHKTRNCLIAMNYIHNYCLTKADGGGIYTWQLNTNHNNGNLIDHNIVLLGQEGENLGMIKNNSGGTFPIYCDDRTDYITVSNNTCAGGVFSLYLHSAANMRVVNNTLYSGRYSIIGLKDDNSKIEMVNNIFENNKLIYSNKTGRAYYFKNMDDELKTNTVVFKNNLIVDLFNPEDEIIAATGRNTSQLGANWKLSFPQWEKSGFTNKEKSVSKSAVKNKQYLNDCLLFLYNPSKLDKTEKINNGYTDLYGNTIKGHITLKPYESAIIINHKH